VGDPLYSHELYLADDTGLYALDEDGVVLRQLSDAPRIGSLNYYDRKLYYVQDGDIVQMDPQTGASTVILKGSAEFLYFDGGRLYFTNVQDGLRLYSVRLDGSAVAKVSEQGSVFYRNIIDGVLYYADGKDGNALHRLDLVSGEDRAYPGCSGHWLSVCNGRIYYHEDLNISPALIGMGLDGSDKMRLSESAYSFTVATPQGIFAWDAPEDTIVVMDYRGEERSVLVDGDASAFCVVDGWIVYGNEADGNRLWMVRHDGSDAHRAVPEG
jgi:hypothetical protein